MTETALNREINSYIKLLSPTQKQSIIQLIKSFLKPEIVSNRISIEQYNKEIEEAEKSISQGNFFSHEEVLKFVGRSK